MKKDTNILWLSLIFEEIMITLQCNAFVMGVSVRGLKAGIAVMGAAGYGVLCGCLMFN